MIQISATDASSETRALDRLERLGGAALVRKMVHLFVTAAGARVEILRGDRDAESSEVRMVAHSLKTSAGLVGADRLLELATDTEAAAVVEDTERLEVLIPALCREFDRAVICVTHLAAALEPSPEEARTQ